MILPVPFLHPIGEVFLWIKSSYLIDSIEETEYFFYFDAELRTDLENAVPLTVLINPSYHPIEETERALDWEGCFSVRDLRGKVYRYKTIKYEAYDEEGHPVKGIARGFEARLLQHEIDHINGIVVADIYDPDSPCGSPEEMKKIWEQEDEELEKGKDV